MSTSMQWDVINRLETRLPASPFTDEWAELHPKEQPGVTNLREEGRRGSLRLRVKHREATVANK